MTARSISRHEKALTLVELMIAILLVTLSVGGIISVVIQSVALRQSVDNAYAASNIARNRIERIREIRNDMGYTHLSEAAETDTLVDRNGVSDPNGEFKRTTIINTAFATNLTKVTVRVLYKRNNIFTTDAVEVVTLVSPYKEYQ